MRREALSVVQGGEAPPDSKIRALLERIAPEPHTFSREGKKFIAEVAEKVSEVVRRNT
jgi:hypothetical protein